MQISQKLRKKCKKERYHEIQRKILHKSIFTKAEISKVRMKMSLSFEVPLFPDVDRFGEMVHRITEITEFLLHFLFDSDRRARVKWCKNM